MTKPTDITRTLKNQMRCYVAEVNGKPWFTESHYAIRITPTSPVWQMFVDRNIDPYAPAVISVGRRGVLRVEPDNTPPNIGQILPTRDNRGEESHQATITTNGHSGPKERPALVDHPEFGLCVPMVVGETVVTLQKPYYDIIASEAAAVRWFASAPNKGVSAWDVDDTLVGVIMPIR